MSKLAVLFYYCCSGIFCLVVFFRVLVESHIVSGCLEIRIICIDTR
jgi:hypothetical protein